MKRFLLFLGLMLSIPGIAQAAKIQRVEFHYTLDNFLINYQDSMVYVSGLLMNADNLPFDPSIPYLAYGVRTPKGMKCVDYRIEIPTTILVCEDKVLATNDAPVPQAVPKVICKGMKPYPGLTGRYPTKKIICDDNGYTFYPFEYDVDKKQLLFTPSIIIERVLQDPADDSRNEISEEDEIVEYTIYHGNDKINMTPSVFKLDSNYDIVDDSSVSDPVDYIIIADEVLEDAFRPLMEWKTQKGLRTRLTTIQAIENEYDDASLPEKIKSYIYDMYANHGASYVLLDGYVPTVNVKVESIPNIEANELIPTDLYYACFDRQFDWDGNQNGILGEIADDISLVPDIIVTRLPVNLSQHAKNAVNKIVGYEKNPKVKKRMFMEGALLSQTIEVDRDGDGKNETTVTDGQYFSEQIYNTFIKNKWSGDLKTIYSGQYMGDCVGDALRTDYGFIDIQAHGEPDRWIFKEGDFYTSNDAKSTVNPGYTIITTNACNVNSFDTQPSYSNPCLSQALISEPRNGVVGFLGSTRQGWGYGTQSLGPSQIYIGSFYGFLFDSQDSYKNFGKLVAKCKGTLERMTESNPLFRWLQFSINPIGDPEMHVYTGASQSFTDVDITVVSGGVNIDAGVDGCVIAMTGELNGRPYQKVVRNRQEGQFSEVPDNAVICITKPDYKPYICDLYGNVIQSLDLIPYGEITDLTLHADNVHVSLDVDEEASEVYLSLTEIMTNSQTLIDVSPEENRLTVDTGNIAKGFYVLNLYVDGCRTDSRRFVKQ